MVSSRDLVIHERVRSRKANNFKRTRDAPEVLPNRVRDAAEEDALRVDDAEGPDRRDVLSDDVLRFCTGVKEPPLHRAREPVDEKLALVGFDEAGLRERQISRRGLPSAEGFDDRP